MAALAFCSLHVTNMETCTYMYFDVISQNTVSAIFRSFFFKEMPMGLVTFVVWWYTFGCIVVSFSGFFRTLIFK